MAVLGARPFLAPAAVASSCTSNADANPRSTSVSFCGCLSSSATDVSKRLSPGGLVVNGNGRGRLVVVVGRAGGSRPAAGAKRPRPQQTRRPGDKQEGQGDGTLLNGDIRYADCKFYHSILLDAFLFIAHSFFKDEKDFHEWRIVLLWNALRIFFPARTLTSRLDWNAGFLLLGFSTRNRLWYVSSSKFCN